ncbi:unnamed protein product [Moneuplotes crassus]|uniref:Uncharacterized protein n=1 Tax=Euplotes crassus TaxID=5936 RepID=A0AAD1Y2E5_EUPCR|nr:unnamed protein product [Moneuplotes crassus]
MDSSSFLIKEYESLYNESRKKSSGVAKACKNAVKALKESQKDIELVCDKLLGPIGDIIELREKRLYPSAFSILGKVCMTTYLTKEGAMKTVEVLKNLNKSLSDEMTQIHVLQIIMVCISPVKFSMSQTFVDNVLSILLHMYLSKQKSVMSTSKAALTQLFNYVINDLVKSPSRKPKDFEPDEETKGSANEKMEELKKAQDSDQTLSIVVKLLNGLVCHLHPDKESVWDFPVNNFTTALVLDLLSVIISEGKDELSNYKQIMMILDEVFDPLLGQITSMKSNYAISIRMVNCITLFAIHIECGLEPLTGWCLTFINIKSNTWQKLIAFEVLTYIFNSRSLVKTLSESNEQYCLANILTIMEKHLEVMDKHLDDQNYGESHPSYQSQKLYKHLDEKNFDCVILPPNNAVLIKLLVESLKNLSYKFNDLSSLPLETFKQKILTSTHIHKTLNILTTCLDRCSDEINIQTILLTFQNLLYISGKIGNSKFRATIINSLAKYACPAGFNKISKKNILVIKCALNIYHCLNEYLDSKCWYYVYKIFQKVEPVIRKELGLQPVEEARMGVLLDEKTREDIEEVRKNPSEKGERFMMRRESVKRPINRRSFVKEEGKFRDGVQAVREFTAIKRKTAVGQAMKEETEEELELEPVLQSMDITGHQIAGQSFSDEIIKEMLSGLGELLVSNVEESNSPTGKATAQKKILSEMVPKQKKSLFSLRRMTEICLVNIHRIENFWDIITDHLMVISVCNNEDFRQLALEAFRVLIIETFQKRSRDFRLKPNLSQNLSKIQPDTELDHSDLDPIKIESDAKELDCEEDVTPAGRSLKNMKMERLSLSPAKEENKNDEEEKVQWNPDEWQARILKPFIDSISSQPYEEEQLSILKHLDKIIDICYEEINENGWKVIISFLKDLKFARISEVVFKKAYDIVEVLSCNFIDFIEAENLENLIKTIRKYASYHQGKFELPKSAEKSSRDSRGSKIYKRIFKYLVLKDVDEEISINSDSEEESKKNILEETKQPSSKFGHEISPSTVYHFKLLFEEVGMLFNDFQFNYKIRKALIRSVKYMMRNMPFNCSSNLWEHLITKIVFEMMDKSIGKYLDQICGFNTSKAREVKQHEVTQSLQTPTFSLGGGGGGDSSGKKGVKKKNERRMKFNDEVINRFHQRNEDNQPEAAAFGAAPEETPKTIKPSQESLDDQSICLLLLEICEIGLKQYRGIYVDSKPKCHMNLANMWTSLSKIITPLISNASATLLEGILEFFISILTSDLREYIYKKYDSITLGIFEEINSVINRKSDLVLSKKIAELLVSIYRQIFTVENIEDKPNLLSPQNLNVNLHILRTNLLNLMPTIGLNAMRHDNDLKNEEKQIFDFIEYLGELLNENDEALKYYLSFLLNFISYDANEPHYEMFVRRAFGILSEGIVRDQYSPSILFDLLPELYSKTSNIVDLRYHNNSCMSLVFSMKTSASLFETAGMFILQVSSHILGKEVEAETETEEKSEDSFIKPNLSILIPNESEAEADEEKEEDYSENVEEKEEEKMESTPLDTDTRFSLRAIDEEDSILVSPSKIRHQVITFGTVQELILNKIMDLLNHNLLFDISRIEKHNKAVKDAVIKSSQDLDVQVINFIINDLLPHSYKLGKQFEHTLVSIIDKGCNGYLDTLSSPGINMFGSSSTVIAQSNSLSTYCFDNLFQLCSYNQVKKGNLNMKESKRLKLEEIRKKIAKTTTPVLLERCQETLSKFLYDEMKSGSIMMSQQRAEEVVFIMEKLKELEIYPNLLNEIVIDNSKAPTLTEEQMRARNETLGSTKGHLYLLIPLFSEFITSREDMIKDMLKEIFMEIALSKGIHDHMKFSNVQGLGLTK